MRVSAQVANASSGKEYLLMLLYDDIVQRKKKIAVIGLGYVGMPLAVSFAKHAEVIGFDISADKIEQYRSGKDPTDEVGDETISSTTVRFTSNESDLSDASFFIIAVPTPINPDKTPDLLPVIRASEVVGRYLSPGSIVIYESTVYPGVAEDVCRPILEQVSGLVCGKDFRIGYSPERINPGDKVHRLENIRKIVSGMDEDTLEEIANVYEMVIEAGVHRAPNIKVAEAAKVVENSQRDINIAFMNELAMVFDRMQISTADVLAAMQTKWNALPFRPGLVGGHCIGVDPYYFVYQAEKLGYHSAVIASGRKINDGMGTFVADAAIRQMVLADKQVKKARVGILGLTFKENCPDIRNTKVIDIVHRMREYGIEPVLHDPYADPEDVKKLYHIKLSSWEEMSNLDCLILAVAHDRYIEAGADRLLSLFGVEMIPSERVFIDVKSVYHSFQDDERYCRYWSL